MTVVNPMVVSSLEPAVSEACVTDASVIAPIIWSPATVRSWSIRVSAAVTVCILYVPVAPPDEFVISVKDDGEGIPSEYHEKIFQCYFQMDPTDSCVLRGHGLGLAGVMVLVEDMGGKLLLDSDRGKGARFTVKLPVHPLN